MSSCPEQPLGCNKGMTLIEVMVTVAIIMVAMLALLGLIGTSYKSQKYTTQKYEIQDLSNLVRLSMLQPNFCSCNFPTALDLSATTIPLTTLNTVPLGACTPVEHVLASSNPPNNLVPGSSTGLKIQKMQIQDIHLLNHISPVANLYSFDLLIAFDPATSNFTLKPLIITGLTMTTTVQSAPLEFITTCINPSGVPSLSNSQLCNMLGGVFLPSGSCALPSAPSQSSNTNAATGNTGTSASTTPSLPSGTVVANCYTATLGTGANVTNCTGGAALPSTCPPGSVVSNYYSVTGLTTNFQCKTP